MPLCPACGAAAEPADRYCPHCGKSRQPELPAGAAPHDYGSRYAGAPPQGPGAAAESKIIPLERVALLVAATYGFYLFYWYYLTWRQYRDHTGERAYPICHTITLLIPIYAWFRMYHHGQVCQRLERQAGDGIDTVIPILPVLLFLFSAGVINIVDLFLDADWPLPPGRLFAAWLLALGYIALHYFLIRHLQQALNHYWRSIEPPGLAPKTGLAVMEIILMLPGALGWLGLLGASFLTVIDPIAAPELPAEAVRLLRILS